MLACNVPVCVKVPGLRAMTHSQSVFRVVSCKVFGANVPAGQGSGRVDRAEITVFIDGFFCLQQLSGLSIFPAGD